MTELVRAPWQCGRTSNEWKEPVAAAKIPNLLVNGAAGIAVGMATNIPPHNLGELCRACVQLIEDPDATTAQLLDKVKGPDFPLGGKIVTDRAALKDLRGRPGQHQSSGRMEGRRERQETPDRHHLDSLWREQGEPRGERDQHCVVERQVAAKATDITNEMNRGKSACELPSTSSRTPTRIW